MTFHMERLSGMGGTWSAVDLVALQAGDWKLSVSYSHPTRLSWTVCAAQHTAPIPRLAFVRFWDDAATDPDGVAFSSSNPAFEGFVEDITPGNESNLVEYVAFDPTYRSTKQVTVMDVAYVEGVIPGTPPAADATAIPRLVYNAKSDADPDFAWGVGHDGTIGQVVAGILEYCYQPLYWLHSAPGTGDSGGDVPYVSGDLTGMAFEPQEKLVFESENPRSALDRLIRYEPRYRMLWRPGSRRWRFHNITASATVTLTLNDASVDHPVYNLQLTPSFEQAATAVKIFGPPSLTVEEFVWVDGGGSNTLAPVDAGTNLQTYTDSGGSHSALAYSTWQIVDSTKRRGGRLLPTYYQSQVNAYEQVDLKAPILFASWDAGTTWTAVWGVYMDYQHGQAIFSGTLPYVYRANSTGGSLIPGSTQTIFPPNAMKLVWAPFGAPLSVRKPASGYEGTAYTVAGLAHELQMYDESLAVGYEYGVPVTTTTRRAKFEVLAQALLDYRKDIAYPGAATLEGIDWQFCRLDRRIDIDGNDGSGGVTTTGWEAIGAVVTDVEYDFENQLTSLTFSADWLALLGEDPAQLRERLKIKALEQREIYNDTFTWITWTNMMGQQISQISGIHTSIDFEYVDPLTGQAE